MVRWRVGSNPLDVYEGDRPVCQCHNEEDARRIVDAVNATLRSVGPHHWSTTSSFCQTCGVLRTPYVENLACPGPGAPA